MTDDAGDWIEHDGMGLPVPPGTVVEVVHRDGTVRRFAAWTLGISRATGRVGPMLPNSANSTWHWAVPGNTSSRHLHVVRYRVPKPKGMALIEAALRRIKVLAR